jgi:hypothetical protein
MSSTVFESQVLSLRKRLMKCESFNFTLLIGQRVKARIPIVKFFKLWRAKSISFLFLKPQISYEKLARRIEKKLKNESILHCRNIEAAYVGLLIKEISNKQIEVIYDVRGYVEGEKAFFNEKKNEQLYVRLNQKLFSSKIYFNFVSQELFNLYDNMYVVDRQKCIFCNSAYDDNVFLLNDASHFNSNKIKIVFVGGNQLYHKIEDIIQAMNQRKDVEMTIITQRKLILNTNATNVKFLHSLDHNQINDRLNAFDYGIIYRDSQAFNNVATPTKVSEYMGKGLQLLVINSAGSYTSLIQSNKTLGLVVKDKESLKDITLNKTSKDQKLKINKFALENLSLTRNINEYVNLYKEINKNFKVN